MFTFLKEVVRQHYLILLIGVFSAVFWPQIKQQYYGYITSKTEDKITSKVDGVTLFTKDELARYNGEENSLGLYIAILGSVYDVSIIL